MRLRLCLLLLLGVFLSGGGAGRTQKPGDKQQLAVAGYDTRVIEGFKLLINKEVLDNNSTGKYERKPLDVLELELKAIVRVMNPKALETLRRLLIWVEWDERVELSSGRQGIATAVYYGGHQLSMLKKGMHPLKANNISILNMKALTAEHQPARDSGRCVILHEMAHAVHHQLIGFNHPQIQAAFQQAMERKLYDKTMYAATSEKEFFAELTCAYLDKLHYYPKTREDLKKHDPVTYKLMASIWIQPKGKSAASSSLASPFNLQLTTDDVRLGPPVTGKVAAEDLKGRVVLIHFWGVRSQSALSSLAKVAAWHTELSDFGLRTVGVHAQKAETPDIRSAVLSRGVSFPIVANGLVQNGMDFKEVPHCFLFDHSGQCVYRGSPFDAETELKAAVGRALVARAGVESFSKSLLPHVEALEKGKAPTGVLQKIIPLQKSGQSEIADQAKALVHELTQSGQKALDEAEARMQDEPVDAFLRLERLPATFKNTTIAAQAEKLLAQLKQNKAVAQELKARPSLEAIKRIDTHLSGQPGAFDPKQPKFQQTHQASLAQMRTALLQMTKAWPSARATEEAARIGEKYGVMAK